MTTPLVTQRPEHAAILERVVIGGDLSTLQPAERILYYRAVCDSIGVNPLTKPFEYLTLNGRLVLYARKDCTDQLRSLHAVSITDVVPQQMGDIYVVTAKATDGQGRTDMATGAVPIKGLAGEGLANALMKAETKAKRRVTLSLCGLGMMLDETEVETIPGARAIAVDLRTGEVVSGPPPCEDPPERRSQDGEVITEAQVRRLSAIATGSKWSDDQVHDVLAGYQYNSRKEIKVADYDEIIERVKQRPGPNAKVGPAA